MASSRRFLLETFLLILLLASPIHRSALAQETLPRVRVGMSLDGGLEVASSKIQQFHHELEALMEHDFEFIFDESKILPTDGTRASAKAANDQLLADPEVDIIFAMGVVTSADLAMRTALSKPCIAPFVMSAKPQGVPKADDGSSGVPNLCYIEPVNDFDHDVEVFRKLVEFDKLALFAAPGFLEALQASPVELARRILGDQIELTLIPVDSDVETVMTQVPEDVGAAYLVFPLLTGHPNYRVLVKALTDRGIPTMSVDGERGVKQGALLGLIPEKWYPRLSRRAALNARRMLTGQDGGTLPVAITRDEELFINAETARHLGVYPTFDMLTEATMVGETRRPPVDTINLWDAMDEAIEMNRDLVAFERLVDAGHYDVNVARSVLLPQIGVGLDGSLIDEDRAAIGFFGAERIFTGSIQGSQVLWSESAWANLSIRKHLQRALEYEYDRVRLDIALDAAQAYFDVLRAETLERIQRDNLKLTRSNLERAQVRVDLGAASPAEVYRWETQIAQDRDALVTTIAERNVVQIELNRVLNRELEVNLALEESQPGQGSFDYLDGRILAYVSNPRGLRIFRSFMVTRGLMVSPELAQIEANIEAQSRYYTSTKWAFLSPDFVFTAGLQEVFNRSGAGSDLEDSGFLDIDDTNWEMGLSLSLPLFNGAERFALKNQASADLLRLQLERESIAQRVEQRIRSSVHITSASYTRIGLTAAAAEAARKNLELVTDAYERGAVSIIDLLDAQNSYLNSLESAANANFQFLSDVMEVERSVGSFTLLTSPEEQERYMQELQEYFESQDSEE